MFKSPVAAKVPPFSILYADLSYATHRQISRHLGLSESTLSKYLRTENAPRAVMLAMFWESRWGRSAAHCEAANFAQVHYALAQCLREKNDVLLAQITQLEQELANMATQSDGAANGPIYRVGIKPVNF